MDDLKSEAEQAGGGCMLYIMVGLPYSGKSTFALAMAKNQNMPIVSPDAIRIALHGERYNKEREPEVWHHARLMVNALFEAGHTAVVLDACNITASRRVPWINDQYPWRTSIVVLDTPPDVCLQRANQAEDSVIVPHIERMATAYEPPTSDEATVIRASTDTEVRHR